MYPTKEEIIKNIKKTKIKRNTIKTFKLWKNRYWKKTKNKTETIKRILIENLLKELAKTNNIKIRNIEYNNTKNSFCIPETKTIILGNPISIISALHEFAHLILGKDEKLTCYWSIKLFKKVFKKEYNKLIWDNHKLTKKNERNNKIHNTRKYGRNKFTRE